MKALFGYDRHPIFHKDIIEMRTFYVDHPEHILIGAYNEKNELLGTIGGKTFIDRFDFMKGRYDGCKLLELGRCFIDPTLRRSGIGSILFDEFLNYCEEKSYKCIYLHTHRHLPGGFDFWIKKGFYITKEFVEEDIVHMERQV